ncbi:hypothetical protein FB45DRAFT_934494 [Roridomyces roridus]|uniref:Secreted protein n=1 Tax=Roridomyces roridus TaxID=1738132 RepID=A0AAD7FD03_9AGAR|nr:hypothetical protein FB45DRAFT_934494 [Roridomyces roridus]
MHRTFLLTLIRTSLTSLVPRIQTSRTRRRPTLPNRPPLPLPRRFAVPPVPPRCRRAWRHPSSHSPMKQRRKPRARTGPLHARPRGKRRGQLLPSIFRLLRSLVAIGRQ